MLSVYIPLITIYPYICYSLLILFPVLCTLVLYRIWVTPISKLIFEKEYNRPISPAKGLIYSNKELFAKH